MRIVLLVFLVASGLLSFTQSKDTLATVCPTQMNVFYMGVPNPIEVVVSNIPDEEIAVTCDEAEITKLGWGRYYVNITKHKVRTMINTYHVKGKDSVLIDENEFRIKRIPDPEPGIAGHKSGGSIRKTAFYEGQFLYARRADGFDLDANFVIMSYDCVVISDTTRQEFSAKMNRVTKEIADAVRQGEGNCLVIFKNIIARYPDKTLHYIGEMWLVLLEK